MNAGAFYQPKSRHPTALAVVVLMHGAAITALALAKMDVIGPPRIPPTVIDMLKNDPTPPEVPPEPVVEKVRPQQPTQIDLPPPIIVPPFQGPSVTRIEDPPIKIEPVEPGPIVLAKADPIPPPPRKVQPARAKGNLASHVSDADYPAAAIRGEEQGTTRFRLGVGADGKVTDCVVTASSGSSALDSATCRIMKSRARFTPARNSDGKPVGDSVTSAIRWVLPEG